MDDVVEMLQSKEREVENGIMKFLMYLRADSLQVIHGTKFLLRGNILVKVKKRTRNFYMVRLTHLSAETERRGVVKERKKEMKKKLLEFSREKIFLFTNKLSRLIVEEQVYLVQNKQKTEYKYNYHLKKFFYLIPQTEKGVEIRNCNFFSKQVQMKEYMVFFEEYFERALIRLMKYLDFSLIFNSSEKKFDYLFLKSFHLDSGKEEPFSRNVALFFIVKQKDKRIRKIQAFYQNNNMFREVHPTLLNSVCETVQKVKSFLQIFDTVLITYFQILGSIDRTLQGKLDDALSRCLFSVKFFVPLTFIKSKLRENKKTRYLAKNSSHSQLLRRLRPIDERNTFMQGRPQKGGDENEQK